MDDKWRKERQGAGAGNLAGWLNRLSQMVPSEEALEDARLKKEREEAERVSREEDEKAFEVRMDRRFARITRWAEKLSKDELMEHLAMAALLLMEKNRTARQTNRIINHQGRMVDDAFSRAAALKRVAMDFARESASSQMARRKGAMKKLAQDPKQAAKAEAFMLWQDWQAGKTLQKSGAAFARFVCEKYPVLESPTTVERWARKWAAEKSKK